MASVIDNRMVISLDGLDLSARSSALTFASPRDQTLRHLKLLILKQIKIERFTPLMLFSRGPQGRNSPVNNDRNLTWNKESVAARVSMVVLLLLGTNSCWTAVAQPDGPMGAKVNLTTLQSYSGNPLSKPDKILIYDLVPGTDIQVDKSQTVRPRHLIAGDENPEAVVKNSEKTFSEELAKKLAKTGIPVPHVTADTAPSDGSLIIQGTFVALHEGTKTERTTVGMGLGSAGVQTKIDVRLKKPAEAVLVSQFKTETTVTKNVGAVAPAAAGLDPAAVAAKSVVTDRKKTLNHDVVKTADASANEITKVMAAQGWIKLNDKGEVAP